MPTPGLLIVCKTTFHICIKPAGLMGSVCGIGNAPKRIGNVLATTPRRQILSPVSGRQFNIQGVSSPHPRKRVDSPRRNLKPF